jgi:type III pantothenate kinase
MRILAVDAGNSRIKWGVWEGDWTHHDSLPIASYAELLATWEQLPGPYALYGSNVAGPQLRAAIDTWAAARGIGVHWIVSRAQQCGVVSCYRDPTQLGTDRWASLIGAWHRVRGAAVVVNAGTAVTIDVLDDAGLFHGGVILPGLRLMASALARGTAGLDERAGNFVRFPDNTADAIASGALLAVCGAVDRMRAALPPTLNTAPVVLSGGAAEQLAPHLPAPLIRVPYSVLEGLRVIAHDAQSMQ